MNIDHDLLTIERQVPLVERQFSARSYRGNHAGPAVLHMRGNTPIVLSSPHATNHPREGQIKLADTFTGTLAIQLARLVGASALIYARTTDEDPNDDADGPFKRQLHSLLTSAGAGFVLDLHGMSQARSVDVESGTAHGVTPGEHPFLFPMFIDTLKKAGIDTFVIDGTFPATRLTTIASFTWRTCKVPAIQLEIHKRYRDPQRDPVAYATLLSLLRETLCKMRQWL